jgi:Putative prokaryotic signal transducing protein
VFVANGQLHAQQVRSFLAAEGVETVLRGESLSKTHGLTLDGLGQVEILVDPADEERARALLASADAGALRLDDNYEG